MKKYLLIAFLALMPALPKAQSLWPAQHLAEVKSQLDRPFYAACYQNLISNADKIMTLPGLAVTQKELIPASGDKHDYMSLSRYYWPDPSKPDGLPYIRRDGESNPELNKLDRVRLGNTASRIQTLALAWYFSGDEKYAEKATDLIRIWFFDKETAMNPNLEYAQYIPGHNGNKGRKSGVLDGYSFIEMLDAVRLLESSKSFTADDSKKLKKWFSDFLQWLLTAPNAIDEANATNNHSVACDAQLLAFALYTGNDAVAKKIIDEFPARRIFAQVQPDGSQPRELQRTLSFGYSTYNITHFIDIYLMAMNFGHKIDGAQSADGRSFYKAVDYLTPYLGKEVSSWPYKQISQWNEKQQELCRDIYKIAVYINPDKTHYLSLFNDNRRLNLKDPFFLLYYKPTPEDDTMVSSKLR